MSASLGVIATLSRSTLVMGSASVGSEGSLSLMYIGKCWRAVGAFGLILSSLSAVYVRILLLYKGLQCHFLLLAGLSAEVWLRPVGGFPSINIVAKLGAE